MAQILFPDIGGSFQNGFQTGTQNRLLREGEQKQSALSALAGQAYGASGEQRRGLIGQAVSLDPQAGLALEKGLSGSDDARTQTLVNASKLLTSAPEQQRASLYAQMKPDLARLGLQLPEQYDASVDQTAQAIVQAYGNTAATGVQSTYVDAQGNRVAILRDGSTQILGQNAPNNQIIDTGDGFYGVNKGNLGAAPVRIGGGGQQQAPQAPQSGMYQTPQGVVRLGDDLSPEQREAAMADIAAGGGVASVQLPDRGVSQPTGGGQQLRSAPKPVSPIEQSRLEIERERLRLSQNADQRAATAATIKTNKPIPPAIFKLREETVAEAETAQGINTSLNKHLDRLESGKLTFGPVKNKFYEAQNAAGSSSEESRNYAEFKSDLEKLRNDSLRLNAGVQTDGDAQRAWNELFANINDPQLVKQRLATIRDLNARAETLKRASVERIDEEYGGVGAPQAAPVNDDESLFGKYLD